MFVLIFAFLATVASVSASPYSRQKRFDAFDSFPSMYYPRSYAAAYGGFGFGPFWPLVPVPVPVFAPMVPWYKGDNVCVQTKTVPQNNVVKEWMDEGFSDNSKFDMTRESSSCRGNNDKHVCVKSIETNEGSQVEMIKYQCCLGFVRPQDGSPGCVEIDLRSLMPTLRNMGASEMVKVAEKVGMTDDFHDSNYTVFCPPNSALEMAQNEVEDEIDNDITTKISQRKVKKKIRLYNIVASHLSPGFFKADDLVDGKILPTDNPTCEIRINVYFTPLKVITANCVPVLSGDHFARNGIVHVVEKLLPMPTKTVVDIIAGDTQFTILKRMLSSAGLVQALRNASGSFTVFAPTDSAFKSAFAMQAGESDNRCTVNLMKHHIVDHVLCSSALPQHARSLNLIGELLSLSRDSNHKLYVDDVQVVARDWMATNGVVHVIDGILSARQTKPVSQVLEATGLHEFLSLLEEANLKSEFDSLENVTFFIPADEVMQSIPPRHLEALLKYNNHTLQDVLRFHVVEGRAELKSPDQLLRSKIENASVRFQVYTKYPQLTPQVLAQCATVLNADIKLCGGTLHVIDKLLLPPKLTILEFLEGVEGFSTLVLLLRTTGLDRRLRDERSAFTLFAPTDDAFHEMGEEAIFGLLENAERATDLLKMHIIIGTVCCSQLNNDMLSGRHQTRTMEGSPLKLGYSVDSILMVGGAHVVDCDIMATNGVIHMVDTVISQEQISYLGGGFLDNLFIIV